jgi:hypothetical protein
MPDRLEDFAFVVVVIYGPDDVTQTTCPSVIEAEQHVTRLLKYGVPQANIRVYRTRLVRASLPYL